MQIEHLSKEVGLGSDTTKLITRAFEIAEGEVVSTDHLLLAFNRFQKLRVLSGKEDLIENIYADTIGTTIDNTDPDFIHANLEENFVMKVSTPLRRILTRAARRGTEGKVNVLNLWKETLSYSESTASIILERAKIKGRDQGYQNEIDETITS